MREIPLKNGILQSLPRSCHIFFPVCFFSFHLLCFEVNARLNPSYYLLLARSHVSCAIRGNFLTGQRLFRCGFMIAQNPLSLSSRQASRHAANRIYIHKSGF